MSIERDEREPDEVIGVSLVHKTDSSKAKPFHCDQCGDTRGPCRHWYAAETWTDEQIKAEEEYRKSERE